MTPSVICHDSSWLNYFSWKNLCRFSLRWIGAFDRFVYIHGHSSNVSAWSKWCRRASTKSGSIILLLLPILGSLPIAFSNLLQAHVLTTSSTVKNCTVQYTHGIVMNFLIFFYILPLLFSFFLHAKLIYFIRSKHHQHYVTEVGRNVLPMKRFCTLENQLILNKKRQEEKNNRLSNSEQLMHRKLTHAKNSHRRVVIFNMGTTPNTAGTMMTASTSAPAGQPTPGDTPRYSNGSMVSRSSGGAIPVSPASPIIFYKINSQANANANRTVLLLVLLLSFYVLCWAPYNIYTWRHAYQMTANSPNHSTANRSVLNESNQSSILASLHNFHSDLRRFIFINYALYLLSMISMCFSFIFYFSLNKQARRELSRLFGCICPKIVDVRRDKRRETFLKANAGRMKSSKAPIRQQQRYLANEQILMPHSHNGQRTKTTKFNNHPVKIPPNPLLINSQNYIKYASALQIRVGHTSPKRSGLNYGCQVECCRWLCELFFVWFECLWKIYSSFLETKKRISCLWSWQFNGFNTNRDEWRNTRDRLFSCNWKMTSSCFPDVHWVPCPRVGWSLARYEKDSVGWPSDLPQLCSAVSIRQLSY